MPYGQHDPPQQSVWESMHWSGKVYSDQSAVSPSLAGNLATSYGFYALQALGTLAPSTGSVSQPASTFAFDEPMSALSDFAVQPFSAESGDSGLSSDLSLGWFWSVNDPWSALADTCSDAIFTPSVEVNMYSTEQMVFSDEFPGGYQVELDPDVWDTAGHYGASFGGYEAWDEVPVLPDETLEDAWRRWHQPFPPPPPQHTLGDP